MKSQEETNAAEDDLSSHQHIKESHQSRNILMHRLEIKEKDLMLAAELGNILLLKNEELRNQYETIRREMLAKLEVISLLYPWTM